MTLRTHVDRYIEFKRRLGYKYDDQETLLRGYADFAAARNEEFTRTSTIVDWASKARSRNMSCTRLSAVRAFAISLHAEDHRHEIPPSHVFGRKRVSRRRPHLLSEAEIRRLMEAALTLRPQGTITPHTWHYMIGLIAVTGLRASEALNLRLSDVTSDGLTVHQTKFRKSRLVPLHADTCAALDDYLDMRKRLGGADDHLFVRADGRPPTYAVARYVFLKLLRQTRLRAGAGVPGPSLHSLRHSFAVRSLENRSEDVDPSRHMLALSVCLGHAMVTHTYWYMEATPRLLAQIAEKTERARIGRAKQ